MEDCKIIDLYFDRIESAIDETAKKYGAYLWTISENILHNKEESEEVVNDVYLAAWNSIPPNRPQMLKHYLARIARNIALNRYDYLKADKRSTDVQIILSELEECIPDICRNTEEVIEEMDLKNAINRFLSELNSEDCGLFVSRYFYVETVDYLAKKYHCTPRRVRYRLEKLRNQLKNMLMKEGFNV